MYTFYKLEEMFFGSGHFFVFLLLIVIFNVCIPCIYGFSMPNEKKKNSTNGFFKKESKLTYSKLMVIHFFYLFF